MPFIYFLCLWWSFVNLAQADTLMCLIVGEVDTPVDKMGGHN